MYDDTIAEPGRPIATVDSWVAPLSLPGGDVPVAAISAVTVAPTHRFGRESDPVGIRGRRFARYDDADGVPQGYVS